MKLVITGIAGFIGSHLAEGLLAMGHEIVGIDDLSAGYRENMPWGCKFIHEDVCKVTANQIRGADAVFHLAASKKNICIDNPHRDLEVNAGGTLHLLQLCRELKIRRFIHYSTGSVIGESKEPVDENSPCRPVSYYGISKLAGENYVKMFWELGLDTTVIRPHHVYGSRQESKDGLGGVIAIFKRRLEERLPINVSGDGTQERLFTHVSALVDASINALYNDETIGMTFNVASSEVTTINRLAVLMGAERVNYIAETEGDIHSFNVDNTLSKAILKIEYLPLKEGLKLLG